MARQGEHPKKKHEAVDTTALAFKETGFQQVGLVEIPEIFFKRFQTGIEAFDNLLGGEGFLPGSSFTVTGRAGAGKTTFLLQMLEALAKNGKSTGYASGEESIYQIAYTSKRLELTQVQIANMTDVDRLADMMKDLDILIIDSWQFIQCKHIEKRKALETYAAKKLVEELGKRYQARAGGYTRILRLEGYRIGDGGSKAILELVDNQVLAKQLAKKAEAEAQPAQSK